MRLAITLLGAIFLLCLLLDKVLHAVPTKELRRRARIQKDKKIAAIYKLAAFSRASDLFIRLVASLSAGGLIVVAANAVWWIGLATALLVIWLVWISRASQSADGWDLSVAAFIAPVFTTLVAFLQPVLSRLTLSTKRASSIRHTGLYEKEDLLELLKLQARQTDNRISENELKTARGALSLVDKTVGEVMLPRNKVKWVAVGETISPMVMDELHQTGQSRFLVVKEITLSTKPEIVGTLYIKDLLDNLENRGKVRDIMHTGANFINESQNLQSAIDGFLTSGHYLLAVVNNFEEVVGAVTIEDVIGQIFGEINSELDNYSDMRLVASQQKTQTDGQPAEAEIE